MKTVFRCLAILSILSLSVFAAGGCRPDQARAPKADEAHVEGGLLALPELSPVSLGGAPLKVIATTSIIGDVVAQVGGEAIALTTLMEPGQDPHSYEPTPQEMAAVAQAHVLFVNGWDLEEALVQDLAEIAGDVPVVPISAHIEPLPFADHAEESAQDAHADAGVDPHTWFSVPNVVQWTENAAQVLSDLDPANAETYARNAAAYQAKLDELDAYARAQLSSIPDEKRYLVTNHDSFGHLAHTYDLHVLGTVLPAAGTMAEPSASDLAALVETMQAHGLCTLFTETTISDRLAQTVAAELAGCAEVAVVKVYTGALGPAGSGADSYLEMFRHNVDAIVQGLR